MEAVLLFLNKHATLVSCESNYPELYVFLSLLPFPMSARNSRARLINPFMQGVPTNELHACGYVSIGCEPCTRPVLPNQHEREGRWWWEVRFITLRV